MTSLFAAVRYAWRAVRAHAALSCAIAAIMAVAIGANTSVFSLVNAVISPTYGRTFGVPPIAGRWFQDMTPPRVPPSC